MFTVDYNKAGNEFELIEKGEYEVTVINYELKKATTGNNRVTVDYEIRSDVEQKHKGQKILYDNFTITEKALWRIHAISKAAKFPNGIEYSTYKEWADNLINKNLIIVVGHKEYNGNTYPEVRSFKESKIPTEKIKIISDQDIPF